MSLTDHVGTKCNNDFNPIEGIKDKKKDKRDGRGGKHQVDHGSDDEATEKVISMYETDTVTQNPNFGQIIKIKGIDLTEDPILWPFVKM